MPTAVVPTAGEAAALPPVPALPMPQELDHVGSFYAKCLAAYDARNHKGTSGRATAFDTHRVYATTYLAARCAVRFGDGEGEDRSVLCCHACCPAAPPFINNRGGRRAASRKLASFDLFRVRELAGWGNSTSEPRH